MSNTLTSGRVRVGLVLASDADDGRPLLTGALTFDERRGAQLLIPYMMSVAQFSEAYEWFRTMTPPQSLVFADDSGVVTLVGLRWRGHSGAGRGTGRLTAEVAIFGQPLTFQDEYRVGTLRSTIDGLDGFTDFRPVKYVYAESDTAPSLEFDSSETVTWESGGFTYALESRAVWSGTEGHQFEAKSTPTIATSRADGATPLEHLRAQRPIRDLLLLAHGQKLAWRSHEVVDANFPFFTLAGETHLPQPAETHFAATVAQHGLPQPRSTSLSFPALSLQALGEQGLRRWTDLYAEETFRRAVQPVAEVINGATNFLEPQLMMLAAALDYFGHYRYGDPRRRAMEVHIKKCLDGAGLERPTIGKRGAIATGISRMNSDLKHPDRERSPAPDELACVVALAKVIARAQLLDLLEVGDPHRQAFLRSRDCGQVAEMFEVNCLRFSKGGDLVRKPPAVA